MVPASVGIVLDTAGAWLTNWPKGRQGSRVTAAHRRARTRPLLWCGRRIPPAAKRRSISALPCAPNASWHRLPWDASPRSSRPWTKTAAVA